MPSAADHAAAPQTPLACAKSHPLADPTCCNRRNQMQKEPFLFTARLETFPLRQPSGDAGGSAPAALPTGCGAQALLGSPRQPRRMLKGPKHSRAEISLGQPLLALLPFLVFQLFLGGVPGSRGWTEQEQGTAPAPCRTWFVCMCAQHQNRHMCESH